ncbi:MAG: alcohol dehydrogenase catalytic domain-containing protein [Syntrophales bacterium]|jgi:threonine dehydrogenase-like Zn-dependent dehydrogenase
MKALMFDYNIPKVVLKKAGVGSDFLLLKYGDNWPKPKIVHPDHVLVKNRLGGICGSDLHQISVKLSLYASIMASSVNPMPMGHETVGTVMETGTAVANLKPGDRVVYNPLARCSFYGFDPCPSCRMGNYQHCFCLVGIGDGSDLEQKYGGRKKFGGYGTGGFGEYLVGMERQFHKIPDHMPDEVAVLAEPFTIALHAVMRCMPRHEDTVMVLGAGIIGLLIIKALRGLGSKCRIIALVRYPAQGEMAIKLGASETISERNSEKLYSKVAEATGGSLFKPLLSKRVLYGNKGPDLIYDCVASETSVDDDIRLIRSNGKIILVGLGFNITHKVDWSLVIYKEIELRGAFLSGRQVHDEKEVDAFNLVLDIMARDTKSFSGLVTHFFPLEKYKDAIRCFQSKKASNAIKVVFDFRDSE